MGTLMHTKWALNGYSNAYKRALNGHSGAHKRVLSGYSNAHKRVLNGYSNAYKRVLNGYSREGGTGLEPQGVHRRAQEEAMRHGLLSEKGRKDGRPF